VKLLRTLSLAALVIAPLLLVGGCSKRVNLQNKGSDTMLEVAQRWAEVFHDDVRPDVGIAVTGGGSSIGIAGIINGTVDIANCSRRFKPEEIEDAKKHGHEPVEHQVGFDGIAIFVHKDNPIAAISLEQARQIYVDGGAITKWSQLGVVMPEGRDNIVLISRQGNSGTYEYFREAVLGGKEKNFRLGTLDMNGSKDVVDQVAKTPSAIGYSGLSYGKGAPVRMVPVKKADDQPAVAPSIDSVLDKSYPISRPLFMYTIGEAHDATKAYLDWIVSDAGQRVLMDLGYPPLRKL
jgi:phosphate transport system substrate-binding protein